MKTVLTLAFILVVSASAFAQDTVSEPKVETIEMGVVINKKQDNTVASENTIVRVHKFRNDRVKKALVFTTKRNKAKLV